MAPSTAQEGASSHAKEARWRLSRGRGDYGFELGCLLVLCLGIAGLLALAHGPWPVVAIPLLILLGNAWKAWPVTDVETDGHRLFLERRGRAAVVLLTDVERVEVDMARGFRQAIRVVFRRRTPVGSWVTIEVPMDWMATAFEHRSVRELRALIAQARAAERG